MKIAASPYHTSQLDSDKAPIEFKLRCLYLFYKRKEYFLVQWQEYVEKNGMRFDDLKSSLLSRACTSYLGTSHPTTSPLTSKSISTSTSTPHHIAGQLDYTVGAEDHVSTVQEEAPKKKMTQEELYQAHKKEKEEDEAKARRALENKAKIDKLIRDKAEATCAAPSGTILNAQPWIHVNELRVCEYGIYQEAIDVHTDEEKKLDYWTGTQVVINNDTNIHAHCIHTFVQINKQTNKRKELTINQTNKQTYILSLFHLYFLFFTRVHMYNKCTYICTFLISFISLIHTAPRCWR